LARAWRPWAALAFGALLLGAAPSATILKLAGGGTALVRPQSGAPVAAIELWFRAPSIGFAPSPQPGIANVAALAVAASEPLTGTPLAALVARAGGRFGVSAYPQTIEISALVPASQAASILRTMTGVYFTPVLTQDGLTEALSEARTDERLREIAEPEATLRDELFGALFASGADHYAAGDVPEAPGFTLDDVKSFATRAFRASNATIVLTGEVDAALADAAVAGRGESDSAEPLASSASDVRSAPQSVSKSGPVAGFGYAWAGPPIKDERAATALDFVADYLFNDQSGVVTDEVQNLDASIEAQYVTYYDPGVFYIEATGSQAAAARAKVDAAIDAMKAPLDERTFEQARLRFQYHVTSDVSTPLSLADNFGWYASEGDPAYAPGADLDGGRYMGAVRSLTPDYVADIVRKYLGVAPAVAQLTAPAPTAAK